MRMRLSTAIACFVATGGIAFAQTVAVTEKTVGLVLVNHGNGFVRTARGAHLATGDIVFVKRGGQAVLKYANGCTQTVKPGRVRTVNQADCSVKENATVGVAGAPLLGGLVIAGAGVGAAIALGTTQNLGAPGGGGNRHVNPVSR